MKYYTYKLYIDIYTKYCKYQPGASSSLSALPTASRPTFERLEQGSPGAGEQSGGQGSRGPGSMGLGAEGREAGARGPGRPGAGCLDRELGVPKREAGVPEGRGPAPCIRGLELVVWPGGLLSTLRHAPRRCPSPASVIPHRSSLWRAERVRGSLALPASRPSSRSARERRVNHL